MRIIRPLFFILFLFTFFCSAQTKESVPVTFTSGTFSRPGNNHALLPIDFQFKFRFLGPNTDVNGIIRPQGSLQITEADAVFNCCLYGRRLFLQDHAEGINPFGQGMDPVIVNGTSYNRFYYRGSIRFSGAARVHRYLQKRAVQTVRVPITVTGFIRGYVTHEDFTANSNPLFEVSLDNLKGWAIYTISTHNVPSGQIANHFDIVSVSYEVAP